MVNIVDTPYVDEENRLKIIKLPAGFEQFNIEYGFMEQPNIPKLLASIKGPDRIADLAKVTFYIGKESLIATKRPGMAIWRESLFSFMSRNAQVATLYFGIPPDQVIEVGVQVEL